MTGTYETCTEAAASVRAALKAKGWNARAVSVRADPYSMGSSLHVTVKDPAIPLAVVRAIAMSAERVRYCEVTHEILSGGNRFVAFDKADFIGRDALLKERAAGPKERLVPLGRTSPARECAETILWLLGPGAGYLTGQQIAADGGLTMY